MLSTEAYSGIMRLFKDFEEHVNAGDPHVREWFLIGTNFWPFFMSFLYVFTVKLIGPVYMKNKTPYELRKTMIVYNLFVTCVYIASVPMLIYYVLNMKYESLCYNSEITPGTTEYKIASICWVLYLIKYLEFLDTIFFVLRKKVKLVTNLHVIHHFILPIFGWYNFRTEKNGVIIFPILVNSMIHIVMYSYYALAAMGPNVRKYLWWKRYLTLAQIVQFILFTIYYPVIIPYFGCDRASNTLQIGLFLSVLFLALFSNYYWHTFKPKENNELKKKQKNN